MNTWSRGVERRIATGAYPAGTLPWKHIQRNVFRLQQRILRQACPERSRRAQDRSIEQCTVVHYSAARRGDVKQVHSLHRFFLAYLFSPCFQASALSCTDSTGSQLAEPWTPQTGQPWLFHPSIPQFVTSLCPRYASHPNRAIDDRGLSPHKIRSLVGCSHNGQHQPPPGFAVRPNLTPNATKTKTSNLKMLDQAGSTACAGYLSVSPLDYSMLSKSSSSIFLASTSGTVSATRRASLRYSSIFPRSPATNSARANASYAYPR